MHYCFFTAGSWESNASFVRLREFGAQMLRRGGARVSYLLDDLPFNRAELSLHPQAERHFTPNPRSIGQITARRPHKPVRKLMEMYLDRWLRRRAVLRVVASKYLQGQFKQRFDLDSAYISLRDISATFSRYRFALRATDRRLHGQLFSGLRPRPDLRRRPHPQGAAQPAPHPVPR
jgi:hypothetical protein